MRYFDELLTELKGTGWYQTRINWFLLLPLFFFMPIAFLHQIFVLHIPDHWCQPPSHLDHTTLNISLEDWKRTFIPQEIGPDRQPRPSRCEIFNVSDADLPRFLSGELPGNVSETLEKTKCINLHGWEYDKSEFFNTAVTDNDWVCEKENRATDLFTLGVVGLILGSAVFSALADYKGRRLAFYISCGFMVVFTLIQIGVSHIYPLYMFFKIMAFAAMLPLFQSPLAIATEVSSIDARGKVIGYACITWAIGNCVLPLIGYLIPRWKILRAVCVLPVLSIYFTYLIVPESPRWLAISGREKEAKRILRKMAKVNGVEFPKDIDEKLKAIKVEAAKETSYGYLSLFSTVPLAIRTVCMTMSFTASAFVYYQLVINIGNMAGNTFLNMFLLGLVEGPGCFMGNYFADKFGRRWSCFGFLMTNAILFFVLMWIVYIPNITAVTTTLCMIIKMNISGSFVVAYIQAMEVFPTCVRQSGVGFCTLISQTISIGGPYVVYLGATDLKLPYLVMFLICLSGAISVTFIPETEGATLPETLEEATHFGKNDKFFSFKPRRDNEIPDEEGKTTSKIPKLLLKQFFLNRTAKESDV